MKNWIAQVWCKTMHSKAMWPIHGKYICPTCLREYPVVWEGHNDTEVQGSLSKPGVASTRVSVAP